MQNISSTIFDLDILVLFLTKLAIVAKFSFSISHYDQGLQFREMDLCRSMVGPVCDRVCFDILCVRTLELLWYHWGASGEQEEGCGRRKKRRKSGAYV